MKTKFTPAPWPRDAISSLLRFSVKNSGPWDEYREGCSMPGEHDSDLIATAPKLYKAAFDLLNRLDADKDVNEKGWWKAERDALAIAIIEARDGQC